jgi:hypothetical protein
MQDVGLRSHFIASSYVAPHMVAARSGLIVNISSLGARDPDSVTGDIYDRPTQYIIDQATQGVDVFIHEMVVPPEVWASKNSTLRPGDPCWAQAVQVAQMIENNSHNPQKAFGCNLNQVKRHPRLAIATHFQAEDDTMAAAMKDVRSRYPKGHVSIADPDTPKYHYPNGADCPGTSASICTGCRRGCSSCRRGVQIPCFARGSCGAGNPVVAPCQFLPARE